MKKQNLYFIDFGLEHISLLVAQIEDCRLIKIPLILTKKIPIPTQRPQNAISQSENFDALLTLIYEAENKLKTSIYSIILISKNITINTFFTQSKIKKKKKQKITQLNKEKLSTFAIKDFFSKTAGTSHVLDFICNYFIVDDEKYIQNPYKMPCKDFALNATIVCIKNTFSANVGVFLERAKLHITHYISPCVSVCDLIKNSLSKNDDFLFIDIGSGSTEFCIVRDKCLVHLGDVNLGGIDMTRDIANELKIRINDAEIVKKKISNENNKNINNATTNFVIRQVQNIADARLAEIFEYIKTSIKNLPICENLKLKTIYIFGNVSCYGNVENVIKDVFNIKVEKLDERYVLENDTICKKIKEEDFKAENLQLFSALNFYLNNMYAYQNARRGFLFKIPTKISCFLKDILY